MQFGIFALVEAKETNLWDSLLGSKSDAYCIFLWEFFSFYEKISPPPLDPVGFFQNIFTPTPEDVSNWSSLVNNKQLYLTLLKKKFP